MNPQPKKISPRLNKDKYQKLRVLLYELWNESCPECELWREFGQMHLHHPKTRGSGGGDNVMEWICFACHDKKHRGEYYGA